MVATQEAVSTWQIDPSHALAEFSGKHMMFTTVKGRFSGVRGTIVYDEVDPTRSHVDVEIDAASLESGFKDRDNHLRSPDFLDVQSFPTITFRSTKVELIGDGPSGPLTDRGRVHGGLTIRGITRPVVLEAEVTGRGTNPWGKQVIGFAASTSINRKDWGLTWNVALEAGGWLVGDTIKLSLDVEAVLAS